MRNLLFIHIRLLALAIAAWSSAPSFAQDIPKDETAFTEHVAGLLRKEAGDGAVAVKGPLTLGLGELQANLDRIFAFCRRNADGCADEINTYVKGAAQVHRDRSAPPTREAVRLVVRSTQYLQQAQKPLPADAPALQSRPVAEGLVALPVLDSPRTIRMLTEKDNKTLDLTSDEVHQLARANTIAALKPLMDAANVAGAGQIGQLTGDSFQPSRLAFHDTWAPLADAQGGQLIVAAPATDAVFYIGEDSPAAIDALRALVRQVVNRSPNRLSDTLLRWNKGGWEVVR
jgi:uncharacterized protein YtpQ (UPF0354 family)